MKNFDENIGDDGGGDMEHTEEEVIAIWLDANVYNFD